MQVFVPEKNNHMIFNVESNVGKGGANLTEDVFLVQFLIQKALERRPVSRPDLKERMAKVPLTGVADDDTIDGIKAVQELMRDKFPGTVVDGKVSPARGVDYGGGLWTIVTLNDTVRLGFPEKWPRIQDLSNCPEP